MQLILASQSPRRRELLGMLGVDFTIQVADIDETMDPALSPAEAVAAVSRKKAAAVAENMPEDAVILAADTAVIIDDLILGKPQDAAEAAAMLRLLSGRQHQVVTAMTLRSHSREICEAVTTLVQFRPLTEAEITAYIQTGEPMDKAGAYGIQGYGATLVQRIDGDFYTVMGLPLCTLAQHLQTFGISILA